MSATLAIIIGIVVFALILLADTIHWLLSSALLFILFMWGLVAFDLTILQKIFYPMGIVFHIAMKAAFQSEGMQLPTNAESADLNGSEKGGLFSGIRYHFISIAIGVGMLFVMFFMSSSKGQILGISELAITSGTFSAWITAQFAPAISMALGFVENRMFISILNALLLGKGAITAFIEVLCGLTSIIPFIGPVISALIGAFIPLSFALPVILTSLAFGLFHIVAYNVAWSAILWAALIMLMWIGSYYLTNKDTTAMDTAHGGWNGLLTGKEMLSIAF